MMTLATQQPDWARLMRTRDAMPRQQSFCARGITIGLFIKGGWALLAVCVPASAFLPPHPHGHRRFQHTMKCSIQQGRACGDQTASRFTASESATGSRRKRVRK